MIAAHAKKHNIKPGTFKKLTPEEAQAIKKNFQKHGGAANQPQPKDDGGKGTNGKGKSGNSKEGGDKPVTGKGDDGKKGDNKGVKGGRKRTRAQADGDDDDDDGNAEDDLLNPLHLRSPKKKRAKTTTGRKNQPLLKLKGPRDGPSAP